MKVYTLNRTQFIPTELDTAWDFFSSPDNLKVITPDYLGFKILSPKNRAKIYAGMEISYIVKPLLGVPFKWVTKITDVSEPYTFIDVQKKGPYKLWKHIHTFRQVENGIIAEDTVNYAIPFGFLGVLAHKLFIKKQLNGIFKYRNQVIKKVFGA